MTLANQLNKGKSLERGQCSPLFERQLTPNFPSLFLEANWDDRSILPGWIGHDGSPMGNSAAFKHCLASLGGASAVLLEETGDWLRHLVPTDSVPTVEKLGVSRHLNLA